MARADRWGRCNKLGPFTDQTLRAILLKPPRPRIKPLGRGQECRVGSLSYRWRCKAIKLGCKSPTWRCCPCKRVRGVHGTGILNSTLGILRSRHPLCQKDAHKGGLMYVAPNISRSKPVMAFQHGFGSKVKAQALTVHGRLKSTGHMSYCQYFFPGQKDVVSMRCRISPENNP